MNGLCYFFVICLVEKDVPESMGAYSDTVCAFDLPGGMKKAC